MTKRNFSIMSILVLALMFMAVFSPCADAKSSYLASCMTAANATGCHPSAAGIAGKAPTLTTNDCKSCHHHGLSSTPVVTTDKTSYTSTENILFKFTGGNQNGRSGLVIYNLAGTTEVARGVIAEDNSATLSVPASVFGAITATAIKTKWHGNSIITTNGVSDVCVTQLPCTAHDFSAVINTPAITITVPSCTIAAPTVTFNPTSGTVAPGGTVTYTATVTNKDSGTSCTNSTFVLSIPTETGTTANFVKPSTLSATSCALAPGGTCTSTLTVKAQTAAVAGSTNATTVRATDATNHSALLGNGTVTTTVATTPCTRVAPTVTFNTTAQTVAAGGTVTYTATVTNKDTGTTCTNSTFALSIPTETGTTTNFVKPSTLSASSCALAPGGTCTSTLTVTAQTAAVVGSTNVTTVRATDATNHSALLGNGTVTTTVATAPIAEKCQNGIDDDFDGLIDCADPDCATDPSCTGAVNSSHANINAYNGPTTCIACHSTAGTAVLNSMHGSWTGPTPNVTNISGNSGKWRQTNNYCTDPELADFGCVKCHVTTAAKVLNKDGMVDLAKKNLSANEMDCLICHQTNYFSTFIPNSATTPFTSCVDGSVRTYQVPMPEADGKIHKQIRLDLAPAGTTVLYLARTATRPNNATCVTKCHAAAGGADGVKRGDIDSTMANPPVTTDIHLSSAGPAKMMCTSCHVATNHQIPGRGNDMRGEDIGAVMMKCVDCHTGVHGTSTTNRAAADRHIAHVDCTACHIDSYGKGIPTEMSRDWTKPVWSPAGCEGQGAYVGASVKASKVLPEYRFWNKTSWVYDRNGRTGMTTDPIDGGLAFSLPLGGINDGKLYPFKVHTSNNPVDDSSGKTNFDVLSMFMDGCYDKAAVSGLAFIRESGAYTWKTNKAFQLITHGIVAMTEGDNCAKCHSGTIDTSTVSKLDKLGYKTAKPTSDLCNDCHVLRTQADFYALHDTHRNNGTKCASCHSITR